MPCLSSLCQLAAKLTAPSLSSQPSGCTPGSHAPLVKCSGSNGGTVIASVSDRAGRDAMGAGLTMAAALTPVH